MMHSDAIRTEEPVGYSNIDIAKLVCALLVVVIHTSPLEASSDVVQFYLENVLARVAVPLFYAFSGFLFFRKLTYENGRIKKSTDNLKKLFRYCKKIALLYLGWSLAYIIIILIPMWYQTRYWGVHTIKDCLVTVLFKGTYYHLWFLLSLVYAMPLLYGLFCFFDYRKIGAFAIVLWIGECLTYSYSWIGVEQITLVSFISTRIPIVFDALFRAVPLLTIGAIISRYQPNWHPRKRKRVILLAFFVYAFEASALYFFSPNSDKYSFLFFTPFLAFTGLFLLISAKQSNISSRKQALLRGMSLTIYCLHPLVLEIARYFCVPSGLPVWATVTLASVGLAAALTLWQQKNTK